ncbi:hypothetical protein RYX36_013639 [Vicia faba]
MCGVYVTQLIFLYEQLYVNIKKKLKDADVGQILEDIKHLLEDARVLEDAHDTSIQDSTAVTPHDVPPSDIPCDKKDKF